MRHALTILLLSASVAFGQSLTNTTLDGVTNATLNGVIDNDAAATRTALGLGTAATTGASTQTVNLFCQGDSLTSGEPLPGSSWPLSITSRIATWNRLANVTVTNVAVGGTATTSLAGSQSTTALQPTTADIKITVCLSGTNDIGSNISDNAGIILRLKKAWAEARNNGNFVVACTIPKRDDAGWTGAMETRRMEVNALITAYASDNVPPYDLLYDVSAVFAPLDYATYYMADKIHFALAGNDAFASGLSAILPDPGYHAAGISSLPSLTQKIRGLHTVITSMSGTNDQNPWNTKGLDETVSLELTAGTRALLFLNLPTDANSRVGQELEFTAHTAVTGFTAYIVGGAVIRGFIPQSLIQGQSLRFRKINIGPIWVQLTPQPAGNSNVDLTTSIAGKTLKVKSGTNALAGTVVLTAGAGTITSTAVDANTVIILTLKTLSGTIGGQPYVATITPATGCTIDGGGASNNSTYNWVAVKVN